ncbi:MAG: type II secretion system protein GspD [Limisphaerales bacterium]
MSFLTQVVQRSVAVAVIAALAGGCRSPQPTAEAPAPVAAEQPPAAPPRPRVRYDKAHDDDIRRIFKLAQEGDWEKAESEAVGLADANPGDPTIARIQQWVVQQRSLVRAQAVEDSIRQIDSQNSVFNPTLEGLFTEKKDRGLPARKDVRDAVAAIESAPYVPDSYGKTIVRRGPMFDLEANRGRMSNLLEREVSVQLDNATLETIIFNLGQAEGINFVADKNLPAFKQTLSVNLQKVKLEELLRYIGRNLGVQFQIGSDLIWIVDGADPKKLQEETRFYKLRHGFVIPAKFGASEIVQTRAMNPQGQVTAVTETQKVNNFVNDNAPAAPSIEQAIKEFFKGSKYMIDYERNIIVAEGTPEQLLVMDRIVKEFDRPVQQVLIEARFITISEGAFLQLGVLWQAGNTGTARGAGDLSGLGLETIGVGGGIQYIFTNVFGVSDLTATINALEQTGESQTLSAPRVTLINNLPARISDGKVQYYYEEYQVKTQILDSRSSSQLVPSGKPTKVQSGVSLDVVASIGGDGQTILLGLSPQVKGEVQLVPFASITDTDSAGRVVNRFDIKLPEYRTQEIATRVAVRSGETVVMGGVLSREQATYVDAVPILGNLPLIGFAFRSRTQIDRPRYLLIFVTASIVADTGEFIRFEEAEEARP